MSNQENDIEEGRPGDTRCREGILGRTSSLFLFDRQEQVQKNGTVPIYYWQILSPQLVDVLQPHLDVLPIL